MRKIYILLLMASTFYLGAQTTVNHPQRVANYDATFTDGGGNFDQGTTEFGMWANTSGSGNKQSVAFRNFTETGLPGGTATTMSVGDSFTITLSATRAYGVIGLALLSSPSSTSSWNDRINNYAVQVNLNGASGSFDSWEVVSAGGTVNASSINGSTTYADFIFKFTLTSATTMSVSINNGAEVFNVTLNNQNITGYSVYIADDWNGSANANIYWKPTTEYVYAITLNTKIIDSLEELYIYPNPATNTLRLNKNIERLEFYTLDGKLVKTFKDNFKIGHSFDISNISKGVYFLKLSNLGMTNTKKLIIN